MKKILLVITFLLPLIGFSQLTKFSQPDARFKIHFKNTKDKVRMIGQEFCNYQEIELDINNWNAPKYFSQKGETTLDDNRSLYLFSIERIKEGVFLIKGIKNTDWTEYKFKTKGYWANFLLTDKGISSL